MMPCVNRIVSQHTNDTGSVVIVSHGSVLTNMLPLVLSNIPTDFARTHPLENGSSVVVNVTEQGLACVEWKGKPVNE